MPCDLGLLLWRLPNFPVVPLVLTVSSVIGASMRALVPFAALIGVVPSAAVMLAKGGTLVAAIPSLVGAWATRLANTT